MANHKKIRWDPALSRAARVGVLALIVLLTTVILVLVTRKPPEAPPEDPIEESVDGWADKVSTWLWLVDADHPLPVSFVPEKLTAVEGSGVQLKEEAAAAFLQMQADMPVPVYAANGYISAAAQQNLYDDRWQRYLDEGYSQEKARVAIRDEYAKGGQDEHQLGLTLDVCVDESLTLDYDLRATETGRWLKDHAWEYGFVFREKEGVSSIYKPWQLRYVGTVHAQVMQEMNLTLDEYLKYLEEKGTCYLTGTQSSVSLVIYCTETLDSIPLKIKEVSGDNNGHFIVTCYR